MDTVANIICLGWSINSGKPEYDRYCTWLHNYVARCWHQSDEVKEVKKVKTVKRSIALKTNDDKDDNNDNGSVMTRSKGLESYEPMTGVSKTHSQSKTNEVLDSDNDHYTDNECREIE